MIVYIFIFLLEKASLDWSFVREGGGLSDESGSRAAVSPARLLGYLLVRVRRKGTLYRSAARQCAVRSEYFRTLFSRCFAATHQRNRNKHPDAVATFRPARLREGDVVSKFGLSSVIVIAILLAIVVRALPSLRLPLLLYCHVCRCCYWQWLYCQRYVCVNAFELSCGEV